MTGNTISGWTFSDAQAVDWKQSEMDKLNLGCGRIILPGFINIDFRGGELWATAEKMPFKDNSFDFVLAAHVLEHIPDLTGTMKEVLRILCPGGLFEVRVPTGFRTLYAAFHLRTFNLHTLNVFCKEDSSLQSRSWFESVSATIPSHTLPLYHIHKYIPSNIRSLLAQWIERLGLRVWEWGKPRWRVSLTPREELKIILRKPKTLNTDHSM